MPLSLLPLFAPLLQGALPSAVVSCTCGSGGVSWTSLIVPVAGFLCVVPNVLRGLRDILRSLCDLVEDSRKLADALKQLWKWLGHSADDLPEEQGRELQPI
ncbi:hypothetical protein BKA65DRAFT_520167 [Rhexocercosporidium sp. MPI-PUGE-AT-0058]|nr:hypothetical protein BKA65DRAFT_520167 [Rhexocercosporidium sp. MPI-PUGE-AT-0058]